VNYEEFRQTEPTRRDPIKEAIKLTGEKRDDQPTYYIALLLLLFVLLIVIYLAGCAAQPTSTQSGPIGPVPVLATAAAPAANPAPPDLLAKAPPIVQAAVREYQLTGRAPVIRHGITVIFPYDPDTQPVVLAKLYHVNDIALVPGDQLRTVSAGDTGQWDLCWTAPCAAPGHVIVKPKDPGIETNLVITGDRTYNITLRTSGHYMPRVVFYDPEALLASESAHRTALHRAALTAEPSLTNLTENYSISGPNVPWRPLRAISDDSHVYIQMPHDLLGSPAPTLMLKTASGDAVTNYTTREDYYVVDQLFDRAVMVEGVGHDRREITISRKGV
jgi:type IV secretion system protein VirB9